MTTTPESQRRSYAAWLIGVALALTLLGAVLWSRESKRADRDAQVEEFTAAIMADRGLGYTPDEVGPNRTPSVALFVAAGLGLLSGVILIASVPVRVTA